MPQSATAGRPKTKGTDSANKPIFINLKESFACFCKAHLVSFESDEGFNMMNEAQKNDASLVTSTGFEIMCRICMTTWICVLI